MYALQGMCVCGECECAGDGYFWLISDDKKIYQGQNFYTWYDQKGLQFLRSQPIAHSVQNSIYALKFRITFLRECFLHSLPTQTRSFSYKAHAFDTTNDA